MAAAGFRLAHAGRGGPLARRVHCLHGVAGELLQLLARSHRAPGGQRDALCLRCRAGDIAHLGTADDYSLSWELVKFGSVYDSALIPLHSRRAVSDDLQAELERLRAENEALKKSGRGKLSMK